MTKKGGSVLSNAVIHLLLIGIIFALFFAATANKANGRGFRQHVIEKQIALLIDSAEPGMEFELPKFTAQGLINRVQVDGSMVKVTLDGLPSVKGYPYFTPYTVSVDETETKFLVKIS